MQYLEVYSDGEFYTRFPLGEIDLMAIDTYDWYSDIERRKWLIDLWLEAFYKRLPRVNRAEFYLVFESRMNNWVEVRQDSIDCCDAPFITCNSIEQ